MDESQTRSVVPKKEVVQFLLAGCKYFYPTSFNLPKTTEAVQNPYLWQENQIEIGEFNYLLAIATGQTFKTLGVSIEIVKSWDLYYQKLEAQEIPEQPLATVPEKLDDLMYQHAKNLESDKNNPAAKQATTHKLVATLEQIKPALDIQSSVYLAPDTPPTPIVLDKTESAFLKKLVDTAVDSPGEQVDAAFVEQLAPLIAEGLGERADKETLSKLIAIDLYSKTQAFVKEHPREIPTTILPPPQPRWVQASLTNPKDQAVIKHLLPSEASLTKVAKASQELAIADDLDQDLIRSALLTFLPKKVVDALYGEDKEISYHITLEPGPRSEVELDIKKLIKARESVSISTTPELSLSQNRVVFDKIQSDTSLYAEIKVKQATGLVSWLRANKPAQAPQVVENKLQRHFQATGTTVQTDIQTAMSFVPRGLVNPVSSRMSDWIFSRLPISAKKGITGAAGLLGKAGAAQKAVEGKLTSGIIQLATKLLPKLGAFLGSIAPIVGTIVGEVVSKIATKVVSWLAQNKDKVIAAALGVMGIGAMTGSTVVFVGGASVLVGTTAIVGTAAVGTGITFTIGVISATVFAGMGRLLKVMFFSLAGIAIATAVILFIINSSAYVVPPGPDVFSPSESQYIGVTKTADPTGPFDNDNVPGIIRYTVTVYAKKGVLTNVQISEKCEVYNRSGGATCPKPNPPIPSPTDPNYPTEITASAPFTFTYDASYNSPEFADSAIVNTITVTADVAEQAGAQASGSATIIIGSPPTECFVPEGDWEINDIDQWPKEISAISGLSQATTYMSRLCAGGQSIRLVLIKNQAECPGCGGRILGNRYIAIYPLGLGSFPNTLYTLAHESGHIFAQVTDIDTKYYDDPNPKLINERHICTYPFDQTITEDFPEMIADYIADRPTIGRYFACLDGAGQTFKTKYPEHWKFANENIFKDNLGW